MKRKTMRRYRKAAGSALAYVLIFIFLASVLCASILLSTTAQLGLNRNTQEFESLYYNAEMTAQVAMSEVEQAIRVAQEAFPIDMNEYGGEKIPGQAFYFFRGTGTSLPFNAYVLHEQIEGKGQTIANAIYIDDWTALSPDFEKDPRQNNAAYAAQTEAREIIKDVFYGVGGDLDDPKDGSLQQIADDNGVVIKVMVAGKDDTVEWSSGFSTTEADDFLVALAALEPCESTSYELHQDVLYYDEYEYTDYSATPPATVFHPIYFWQHVDVEVYNYWYVFQGIGVETTEFNRKVEIEGGGSIGFERRPVEGSDDNGNEYVPPQEAGPTGPGGAGYSIAGPMDDTVPEGSEHSDYLGAFYARDIEFVATGTSYTDGDNGFVGNIPGLTPPLSSTSSLDTDKHFNMTDVTGGINFVKSKIPASGDNVLVIRPSDLAATGHNYNNGITPENIKAAMGGSIADWSQIDTIRFQASGSGSDKFGAVFLNGDWSNYNICFDNGTDTADNAQLHLGDSSNGFKQNGSSTRYVYSSTDIVINTRRGFIQKNVEMAALAPNYGGGVGKGYGIRITNCPDNSTGGSFDSDAIMYSPYVRFNAKDISWGGGAGSLPQFYTGAFDAEDFTTNTDIWAIIGADQFRLQGAIKGGNGTFHGAVVFNRGTHSSYTENFIAENGGYKFDLSYKPPGKKNSLTQKLENILGGGSGGEPAYPEQEGFNASWNTNAAEFNMNEDLLNRWIQGK